jgi:hypothetical protein
MCSWRLAFFFVKLKSKSISFEGGGGGKEPIRDID